MPEPDIPLNENVEKYSDTHNSHEIHENFHVEDIDISYIFNTFSNQILSLGISEVHITKVLSFHHELLNSCFDLLKNQVSSINNNKSDIQRTIEKIKNISNKFDSLYKIKKIKKPFIIMPKEIALGTRIDKCFDSNSNTYVDQVVTSSFMYVPILSTLQRILTENFFSYYDRDIDYNINYFEDMYDGTIIKHNNNFFSKNLRI